MRWNLKQNQACLRQGRDILGNEAERSKRILQGVAEASSQQFSLRIKYLPQKQELHGTLLNFRLFETGWVGLGKQTGETDKRRKEAKSALHDKGVCLPYQASQNSMRRNLLRAGDYLSDSEEIGRADSGLSGPRILSDRGGYACVCKIPQSDCLRCVHTSSSGFQANH